MVRAVRHPQEFAIFNPLTDQIGHNSSEVFMTWVGKEASGVRQHTNKVAKQTQIGQRRHLFFHSGFIIIKPPCRTVLDLADRIGILEASNDCSNQFIICWV